MSPHTPLPASPSSPTSLEALIPPRPRPGVGGIAQTSDGGLTDADKNADDARTSAGGRPNESSRSGRDDKDSVGRSSTPTPSTDEDDSEWESHEPRPPPDHVDNPLESIGKAISAPVGGAAEDEEPGADGKPRERPGG